MTLIYMIWQRKILGNVIQIFCAFIIIYFKYRFIFLFSPVLYNTTVNWLMSSILTITVTYSEKFWRQVWEKISLFTFMWFLLLLSLRWPILTHIIFEYYHTHLSQWPNLTVQSLWLWRSKCIDSKSAKHWKMCSVLRRDILCKYWVQDQYLDWVHFTSMVCVTHLGKYITKIVLVKKK